MKSLSKFKAEQMGKVHGRFTVTHCKIIGPYLVALEKAGNWWEIVYIERRDGKEDRELEESFKAGEFVTCGQTYADAIDGLYEAGFVK